MEFNYDITRSVRRAHFLRGDSYQEIFQITLFITFGLIL